MGAGGKILTQVTSPANNEEETLHVAHIYVKNASVQTVHTAVWLSKLVSSRHKARKMKRINSRVKAWTSLNTWLNWRHYLKPTSHPSSKLMFGGGGFQFYNCGECDIMALICLPLYCNFCRSDILLRRGSLCPDWSSAGLLFFLIKYERERKHDICVLVITSLPLKLSTNGDFLWVSVCEL